MVKEITPEEKRRQALMAARPPLDNVLNMHDFENVAKMVLPEKAWVRPCVLTLARRSAERVWGVLLGRYRLTTRPRQMMR